MRGADQLMKQRHLESEYSSQPLRGTRQEARDFVSLLTPRTENLKLKTENYSRLKTENTKLKTIPVRVDKIASATINLRLEHEFVVTTDWATRDIPTAGDVVVVKALTENATYSSLELITGRLARINPGDIIAGVLGNRRALKGFVGDVPETLAAGDRLHLLNMGGLIGKCVGHHHTLSGAIEVEVVGMPVRDGRILNISEGAISPKDSLSTSVPLVIVAGTCMNSGKTYAATEIIKQLARAGLRIAAAKLSGVACLRDTLNMQDQGAISTLSFLDCGLPSTVGLATLAPYAKGIIDQLSLAAPDAIILELGDGILGGYSVDTIFEDRELMKQTAAIVFCASDFVGAWGGRELLARQAVRLDVISGPVTDSRMGAEFVERELGIPAANATGDGARLAAIIKEKLSKWSE